MGTKTLDFSEVRDGDVVLEEGMYVFTIKSVKEKVSAAGNDMWLVVFEEDETKAAVFENYVFTPEALWKVKELCKALGFETDGSIELDPTELIGLCVKGKVVQEEYEGQMKNRMKKILSC